MKNPILINEESKVNWNIVLHSPNAVAYRLWYKPVDQANYIRLIDGTLSDDIPDIGEFDATEGTEFAFWVGFGSNKPQSSFKLLIVFTQENSLLSDGIITIEGRVNDDGVAIVSNNVMFKLK